MPNELTKVAPAVVSLAQPTVGPLLAARSIIQRSPDIQEIFRRAREEKWDAEHLAVALEDPLQGQVDYDDVQEVVQVARYLADEYQQMGDSILIISRETGKALGKVSEEDIWQPEPVPREYGSLAQPLARLNPQLESFLVHWHFERAREQKISTDLAERLHQTELLQQEGDPRLLALSRGGRKQIVSQVHELLPRLLTEGTSGTVGQFLRHFDIREDEPKGTLYEPLLRCVGFARHTLGIQDPKAMNLRYNRVGTICGRVAGEWGREVARTLATAAAEHFQPQPISYLHAEVEQLNAVDFWVADPDTSDCLAQQMLSRRVPILPVANSPTLGLRGPKVGAIVIKPESYACEGREVFDRWEIGARFEYTLWVDWAEVRAFSFADVPASGIAVQVMGLR